jgi:hypothetical protein
MTAADDRAWCEFLDVLTGIVPARERPNPPGCPDPVWCAGNNVCHWECTRSFDDEPETEDDENFRAGTMADGMRRWRRERP